MVIKIIGFQFTEIKAKAEEWNVELRVDYLLNNDDGDPIGGIRHIRILLSENEEYAEIASRLDQLLSSLDRYLTRVIADEILKEREELEHFHGLGSRLRETMQIRKT